MKNFFDQLLGPKKYCTQCGQELKLTDRFCSRCGAESPVPDEIPPSALRQKKLLILVCAAAVLIAAAAIALGVRAFHRNQEYQAHMETGLRFLSEGDYEAAVLAFDAAIEIMPRSPEAHTGRGDANTGLELYETAVDDYQNALNYSNRYVQAYLGLANAYLELGDTEAALEVLEEGADRTGDQRLLQWAETLRRTNGGSSSLNGAVSEYLSGGGTALLPGARVRLYVALDDGPRLARSAVTGWDGGFSLTGLSAGSYILHVDAPEHIGIETVETLDTNETSYTELFLMIPETDAVRRNTSGVFYAYVTNALDGNRVADTEIVLRAGWNNRDGDRVTTTYTDEYGWFFAENLDYGYYTVETSASGYVTAYHNVAVLPEEFPVEWNLPITPVLSAGETRIVLTWNEEPWDLDSHLTSEDFHVYFADKDGYDRTGLYRANLDLDDTSSYGPETITIYQGVSGVYTYAVHDYTNWGYTSSSALGTSGATVRVYQEAGLVAEYHVPAGTMGTMWTVFRMYEDGTIETVNVVNNDAPMGFY